MTKYVLFHRIYVLCSKLGFRSTISYLSHSNLYSLSHLLTLSSWSNPGLSPASCLQSLDTDHYSIKGILMTPVGREGGDSKYCCCRGRQCDNIMMTSSNGNIFRVTGPLCGEFTGPGEFPAQRPVMRSFGVFFHLRLNKRLSKQPRG